MIGLVNPKVIRSLGLGVFRETMFIHSHFTIQARDFNIPNSPFPRPPDSCRQPQQLPPQPQQQPSEAEAEVKMEVEVKVEVRVEVKVEVRDVCHSPRVVC